MKKLILLVLTWPLCSYPLFAQKDQKVKSKENSKEVIVITSGDKEKKLTIETKDGEVFINGKPAAEYKDDDVNVIRQRFQNNKNFLYAPGTGKFSPDKFNKFKYFDNDWSKDKGFLGVTTEKTSDGVKITDVTKGSAADKAGLKEGDVITKVGDKQITDEEGLTDAISSHKPKDDVTISYKRDGKSADVKTSLGERSIFSKSFSYNGSTWDSGFNFKMPDIRSPLASVYGFGRGRLGLSIEDTDNDSGVKIIDVDDESVASKAGLKENDVITEVNGKKVKDVNEVRKELAEVKDKASYNIKANRNGADMNFEIKIPKKVNRANL